jgi:hypothetical protein
VDAETRERIALLHLDGWSGRRTEVAIVVGETATRYRVRAVHTIKLAGRRRYLHPGQTALVPKYAVEIPDAKRRAELRETILARLGDESRTRPHVPDAEDERG